MIAFFAVLSQKAALVGLVIDKGLHAYGDKWVAIEIVMAVHMCVGQDDGIGLQLAKDTQLMLNLGEKLTPKMHRHGGQASVEHADHVVLECLDGLFGKVATIVIGGDEFVCHLDEFNFGLVCKQCLVVEYLVSWDDAMVGHSSKCMAAGKNELALAVIFEGLAPGGVGVQVVEDHDVVVAKAGDKGETTHLVRVHCVLQIDGPNEDVMCDNMCSWCGVTDRYCYVGGNRVVGGTRGIKGASEMDTLALSLHVTHLSFIGFKKILGDIFYVDEGPSAVVASLNGFEPC
jgi:hypothetical protein